MRAPWCMLAPLVAAILLGSIPEASAQSLGIGGRLSFVRPDATRPDTESTRLAGGALRAHLSKRTAVEVSLDYRRFVDEEQRRIRQTPIQASLLLYPFRAVLGMYVLGGVGRYSERIEPAPGVDAEVLTSARTGYHAGLGGELQLGRHAAFHLDYRYTFLHAGSDEEYAKGAVPIPGTMTLQDRLGLSHEGSMWTAGLTVYF